MSTVKAKLDLKDFAVKALNQDILTELGRKAFTTFSKMRDEVILKSKEILKKELLDSPEYLFITATDIQGEIGLVNPEQALNNVIEAILNTVEVRHSGRAGTVASFINLSGDVQIIGEYTVTVLGRGLSEVIYTAEGSFISEKGHKVDWLKWLLTAGNTPVVFGHRFSPLSFGQGKNYSRTGWGIMTTYKTPAALKWSVPATVAGTIDDNWITRALRGTDVFIGAMLEEVFERNFNAN